MKHRSNTVHLGSQVKVEIPSPMELTSLVSSKLPEGVISNSFFSSVEARSVLMPEGGSWILVAANKKWMDTFGDAKIGEAVKTPEEFKANLEEFRQSVMREGAVVSYERKKGEASISVVLEPAVDKNAKIVGVIRRTKDVTAELERAKVEQEARQLKTLNTVLSNFIGDSLNNKLSVAYGYLDMGINLDAASKALEELLKAVKVYQAFTGTSLLRTLGAVAPTDANELLEGMMRKNKLKSYDEREIPIPPTVKIQYDSAGREAIPLGQLPKVSGTRSSLEIAFRETLINAVESIGKKGGTVTISAKTQKDRLLIDIADNGMGMDEEQLKLHQLPFYKIPSTKESARFGLGGYIARQSAVHCGGDINFKSEKGKGTTATIILPIAKEQ